MGRNVAVVGGSIAGLYVAMLLARNGHRVRLFEAMREPGSDERSLIVTGKYRDILGELGEPAIVNEVRRFRLHAAGRVAEVELQRPDLIIERSTLSRILAGEAARLGVEIRSGAKFRTLRGTPDGLTVDFSGNQPSARAEVVIGADGARSGVARAAGLPAPRLVPVVQAIVEVPSESCEHSAEVWFTPAETSFFRWLIPHGDGTGALGTIAHDGRDALRMLDAFAAKRGLRVLGYQGARIPEYCGWLPGHRRLDGGDVYLVGDAAGHVKVTTVGGIVNGLWGAEGVCRRVGVNGHAPSRSLGGLRLELGLHLWIRRALQHFAESDYEALLGILNDPARAALARYSRDESAVLTANLLLRHRRFLPLGLRGLWRSLVHDARQPRLP